MRRRLCVFCGSSRGSGATYAEAARRLGEVMGSRGIELVFGGGHIGLMGVLADAVLEHGGRAIGVIPQALVDRELAHGGLTELHIVAGMHERKALMAELADAFAALPGGFGTGEELLEMITWGQLGFHTKPIGLLNVACFFDPLLAWMDQAVEEGFIRVKDRKTLQVAAEPEMLLKLLQFEVE